MGRRETGQKPGGCSAATPAGYSLCARCHATGLIHAPLLNPHNDPMMGISIPILQMRKLGPGEGKRLAQGWSVAELELERGARTQCS